MDALQSMLSTCDGPPEPEELRPAKVVLVATTLVPTATVSTISSGASGGNPGNSRDCGDFDSYPEAKQWFDTYFADYGDVAHLDSNDDGEPCESLPGCP